MRVGFRIIDFSLFLMVAITNICRASSLEDFEGSWYSKPGAMDPKNPQSFAQLEIFKDKSIIFRSFIINKNEDGSLDVIRFMERKGSYVIKDKTAELQISGLDQGAFLIEVPNGAILLDYNVDGRKPVLFLNKGNAPWSKFKIINPDGKTLY